MPSSMQRTMERANKKIRVRLHRDGSVDVWHASAGRWKPCKPGAAASAVQSLNSNNKSSPKSAFASPMAVATSPSPTSPSNAPRPRRAHPRAPPSQRNDPPPQHIQQERHVLHVDKRGISRPTETRKVGVRLKHSTVEQRATQKQRSSRPTTERETTTCDVGQRVCKPDIPQQLRIDGTENSSNSSGSGERVPDLRDLSRPSSSPHSVVSWDVLRTRAVSPPRDATKLSQRPSGHMVKSHPSGSSPARSPLHTSSSTNSSGSENSTALWLPSHQPRYATQSQAVDQPGVHSTDDSDSSRGLGTTTAEWHGGPRQANREYRLLIASHYLSAWRTETKVMRARRRLLEIALAGQRVRTQKHAFGLLRSFAVAVHRRHTRRRSCLVSLLSRQTLRRGIRQWRAACGLKPKGRRSQGGRQVGGAYLRVLSRKRGQQQQRQQQQSDKVFTAPRAASISRTECVQPTSSASARRTLADTIRDRDESTPIGSVVPPPMHTRTERPRPFVEGGTNELVATQGVQHQQHQPARMQMPKVTPPSVEQEHAHCTSNEAAPAPAQRVDGVTLQESVKSRCDLRMPSTLPQLERQANDQPMHVEQSGSTSTSGANHIPSQGQPFFPSHDTQAHRPECVNDGGTSSTSQPDMHNPTGSSSMSKAKANAVPLLRTLTVACRRLSLRRGWNALLMRLRMSRVARTWMRQSALLAFKQWTVVVQQAIRNAEIADRCFRVAAQRRFVRLLRVRTDRRRKQRRAFQRADAFRLRAGKLAALGSLQRLVNLRGVQRVNSETADVHFKCQRVHMVFAKLNAHRVRSREHRLHDVVARVHQTKHMLSSCLALWKTNARASFMTKRLMMTARVHGRESVLRSVFVRWKELRDDSRRRRDKIRAMHDARTQQRKRVGFAAWRIGVHLEKCDRAALRQYTLTNCRRVLRHWHDAAAARRARSRRKVSGVNVYDCSLVGCACLYVRC
jgi:hypothetical protein